MTIQPATKKRDRWPNEANWAREDVMTRDEEGKRLLDEAQADIDRAIEMLTTDPQEARFLLARATRKQSDIKVLLTENLLDLERVGPGRRRAP